MYPDRTGGYQLCGYERQDETHLFLNCRQFLTFKDEVIRLCGRLHAGALAQGTPAAGKTQHLSHLRDHTVCRTAADPSHFWLGLIPPLNPGRTDIEVKMAHHLANTFPSRTTEAYHRGKAKT